MTSYRSLPHAHHASSRPPARRHPLALLLILLAALAARLPLLTQPGFLPDQLQFVTWSYQLLHQGWGTPYHWRPDAQPPQRWSNYPPVFLYVLALLGVLVPPLCNRPLDPALLVDLAHRRLTPDLLSVLALYKLPAVAADLLTVALLWRTLARRRDLACRAVDTNASPWRPHILLPLAYALHPAVIYDGAAWGQVDALHTLFLLLSVEAASRRRRAAMCAWACLGVLTKAQSLVLLPLWLVCLLRPFRPRALLRAAAAAAITAGLVLAPFLDAGAARGIRDSLVGAVGKYPFLHLNAFSAWFLLNPLERPALERGSLAYARDDCPWPSQAGVRPQAVGLAAVLVLTAFSAAAVWRRGARRRDIRWFACLLPLVFFVTLTQMHERYLFPAIALWAWAYAPGRAWKTGWITIGAAVFLNIAWAWPMGHAEHPSWLASLVYARLPLAPLGVWVAAALVVLLLATLVAIPRRALRFGPPGPQDRHESAAADKPPVV